MNRTLPFLAAALLIAGCPPDGTRPGTPLDVTRITPGAPSPLSSSGLRDPQRTAVFDEAAFADLWARAFAGRKPAPELPKVDFANEFVVVAALGERASGGFAIEVTRAAGEAGGVAVEVVSTAPGKGCPVTLATSQPADVVKIARPRAGPFAVRFVEKAAVTDCGP